MVLFLIFYFSNSYSATCPTFNCPEARDTPIAIYRFENNLLDSSGNNLHATDYLSCDASFQENIGGRAGYSLYNYTPEFGCGVFIPACVIFRNQGEIEWYQYITAEAINFSSCILIWKTSSEDGIFVVYVENTQTYPNSIRVSYTYLINSNVEVETLSSGKLIFNQWQHIQIQWGDFGLRLIVDGIVSVGSYNKWYQGSRDTSVINVSTCGSLKPWDFLYGYMDDLIFWPCSSHGTPTITPTFTATKTDTPTFTFTITQTYTITETYTLTQTFTITPTSTITFTYSETFTETPTFTYTNTFTITPTMTSTITDTPTIFITMTFTPFPSPEKTLIEGIYPNPISGKYGYMVFVARNFCKVSCFIYTVSGELVNKFYFDATQGFNQIRIPMVNQNNKGLSSGIYIYHLNFIYPDKTTDEIWGKFAIIRKM